MQEEAISISYSVFFFVFFCFALTTVKVSEKNGAQAHRLCLNRQCHYTWHDPSGQNKSKQILVEVTVQSYCCQKDYSCLFVFGSSSLYTPSSLSPVEQIGLY